MLHRKLCKDIRIFIWAISKGKPPDLSIATYADNIELKNCVSHLHLNCILSEEVVGPDNYDHPTDV